MVDANAIIAALLRDGAAREILRRYGARWLTVEESVGSVRKHEKDLLRRFRADNDTFELFVHYVFEEIEVVPQWSYVSFLPAAQRVIGTIDNDDAPYVALALARGAVIWSDDAHFRRQDTVKVVTTTQLIETLQNE